MWALGRDAADDDDEVHRDCKDVDDISSGIYASPCQLSFSKIFKYCLFLQLWHQLLSSVFVVLLTSLTSNYTADIRALAELPMIGYLQQNSKQLVVT